MFWSDQPSLVFTELNAVSVFLLYIFYHSTKVFVKMANTGRLESTHSDRSAGRDLGQRPSAIVRLGDALNRWLLTAAFTSRSIKLCLELPRTRQPTVKRSVGQSFSGTPNLPLRCSSGVQGVFVVVGGDGGERARPMALTSYSCTQLFVRLQPDRGAESGRSKV